MKIPYQLVSMAAMLRDYIDQDDQVYLDREHEKLTDIADSLYADVVTPDQFKDEYQTLYKQYGPDYFAKVLEDMEAIDSQLTTDDKVDELWYDYSDRLNSGVTASTQVRASNNPFYDKLSDKDKTFVKNTEKMMATEFSPETFDVYNALPPYIGEYSSTTGWVGSCELKKEKDYNTVDGYDYRVIWDDGNAVDSFTWRINDNPRIGGDYTLMVMPATGMPKFCDNENDFNRVVRKVFGDGLTKLN
jgi:hypothetical protein